MGRESQPNDPPIHPDDSARVSERSIINKGKDSNGLTFYIQF